MTRLATHNNRRRTAALRALRRKMSKRWIGPVIEVDGQAVATIDPFATFMRDQLALVSRSVLGSYEDAAVGYKALERDRHRTRALEVYRALKNLA